MDEPSEQLLARYQDGDQSAAEEMFRRYVSRLTVFARTRLAPRVARRVDAEDVVLSAYRSFFVRARDGQFRLRRSGDLWRLLVAITLNKVRHQVAHHEADKRAMRREENPASLNEQFSRSPRPEHAIAVADELEQVMAAMSPVKRRILELRLLDYSLAEIAADIGRSERTVRRMLDELQAYLERRMLGEG
ncbi:MAG TPA: sigma-70 family RNA polymerase sigma factor [Pirellulales bacterium]|nr:sigma-70 family RNA polymerase sigma factor [Pirellulales bacterium]